MAHNKRMGTRTGRPLGLRSSDDLGERQQGDPLHAFPRQIGVPRDAVEGPEVPGRVRKRRLHLCPVVRVLIHGRAQGLTR